MSNISSYLKLPICLQTSHIYPQEGGDSADGRADGGNQAQRATWWPWRDEQ